MQVDSIKNHDIQLSWDDSWFIQVVPVQSQKSQLEGGGWSASWEICMQVRKQQFELDVEQQIGSKKEKEYVKTVYCHATYTTYMQSLWCEMPGWMN